MPDVRLLVLSGACLVAGVFVVLFPEAMARLSQALNQTLSALDERVLRQRVRYLIALLLFLGSYWLFYLALLVPALQS